jgi:hypothetical protein
VGMAAASSPPLKAQSTGQCVRRLAPALALSCPRSRMVRRQALLLSHLTALPVPRPWRTCTAGWSCSVRFPFDALNRRSNFPPHSPYAQNSNLYQQRCDDPPLQPQADANGHFRRASLQLPLIK